MTEVMCPLCGYTTMVWNDTRQTCPECDRSLKREVERKLMNSDLEWTADGPLMAPVEEAEKRRNVYRMLGVIER
jgi:endogenous inhibitor of DNA gyrase (YacG/DUF329 family)